ncbi:MAG: RHS repeat-associated core domain-containing protein, partial [Bacteroidota bacterium]
MGIIRDSYYIYNLITTIMKLMQSSTRGTRPIQVSESDLFGENNGYTDDYKYKFNGKEYQQEMDLNWYDYGFRFYDPALARFTSVDPLAEKNNFQSGYAYA